MRHASPRIGPVPASIHALPHRFQLLHEIFEAQVDAQPDAPAVVCGTEGVTYAGLEQRANRITRHLHARGVGRGELVGILLPRSVHGYAALLGVLKSGAACVPIDPDEPPDRVDFILGDSGASTLVTTASLAGQHASFPGYVMRLDTDLSELGAHGWHARCLECAAVPTDLCYVIYTSGATGRPTGVMIEHRSACHVVCAGGVLFGVRPGDRVVRAAPPAFDLSVAEMWLAFRAGATLVAASAGPDLARRLSQLRATVLSCAPSLLETVEEDVPTLRLLILGGAVCPPSLAARWARPGRRLVSTYGAAETTVIATHCDVVPGEPVTMGRPLPGYRIRLLDERLCPVAQGAEGEICIGGVGVARGYVNLPARTRDRFVPDPFAPGERLYRSGDRGRLDAAGNLVLLGRARAG